VASVDPELQALAARALDLVRPDTVIGLGAGRASRAFVTTLGARVKEGLRIQGVPASDDTAALAREVGVPLVGLEAGDLDITVDGADEVDPRLDMIKGFGGALTRERIIAVAARRQVILVGHDKLVERLGRRGRVPVEVIPFALPYCRRRLAVLGHEGTLRMADDKPFITDNWNVILDIAVGAIEDARALDRAIRAIPGVVDNGLFLGVAHTVLVAEGGTIKELRREGVRE
jgi:ribose 5-phosphate isomerase A